MDIFIAKVVERKEDEGLLNVQPLGGSPYVDNVRILKGRAHPLYGEAGNMPNIGEMGLVLSLPAYKQFFWLGSTHNLVEHIWEDGYSIFHHDSDAYMRINNETGELELSTPSGTFLKLGGTTLAQRKRFKRVNGTQTTREEVNYDACVGQPETLFIRHPRKQGAFTDADCDNDDRRSKSTGTRRYTDITLDDAGAVKIEHETDAGTKAEISFDKDGKITIVARNGMAITGNGLTTLTGDLSIVGNLLVSGTSGFTGVISAATLNASVAMTAPAVVVNGSDLATVFNAHTHNENDAAPAPTATPNSSL